MPSQLRQRGDKFDEITHFTKLDVSMLSNIIIKNEVTTKFLNLPNVQEMLKPKILLLL